MAQLVSAQKASMKAHELYTLLEAIWQEKGFGECTGGDAVKEELEYWMEKLWYESTPGQIGKSVLGN